MLHRRTIAVVIPAWNEADHIAAVVRGLPPYVDQIVVVDDASTDATRDCAIETADPRLVVLRHTANSGVGAAIVTGYDYAFAHGADVAVVMAGDGQMDPADLGRLLGVIDEGADYAKGNRLVWPDVWRDMPKKRLAGNLALSWLTRRATGFGVRDSQCGFTALTRAAASRIDMGDIWPRYGYPNDLLARLVFVGSTIVEVPVRAVYGNEKSGVTWIDALYVVPSVLARVLLRRLRAPASVSRHRPRFTISRAAAGTPALERAV